MFRVLVTVLVGLLGLAFGSFLNVCLSRWPEDESVVRPRSHCRNCQHTLAWWENIPLLSWIVLRGKCRKCKTWIGVRYLLVELAVGVLWAISGWKALDPLLFPDSSLVFVYDAALLTLGSLFFYWVLIALAALDAENLWLPNFVTLPGIALGFLFTVLRGMLTAAMPSINKAGAMKFAGWVAARDCIVSIIVTAGLLLLIRWLYWVIRHREGMGLGDVKLIAMLAAWLGLPETLLAFFIGAILGAVAGLIVIAVPSVRDEEGWATTKLPFGTFLCIGGIASSLWGQPIIAEYLHFIGF